MSNDFWRGLYDAAYGLTTVYRDENERKLTKLSSFVSHLTNYVFISLAVAIVREKISEEFEWSQLWSVSAWLVLFGIQIVLGFRIAMVVTFAIKPYFDPPSGAYIPEFGIKSILRWVIVLVANVVLLAGLNVVNGAITGTLREIAASQAPKVERPKPEERTREALPSCGPHGCIA